VGSNHTQTVVKRIAKALAEYYAAIIKRCSCKQKTVALKREWKKFLLHAAAKLDIVTNQLKKKFCYMMKLSSRCVIRMIEQVKTLYAHMSERTKQRLGAAVASTCVVLAVAVILLSVCSLSYSVSIGGMELGLVQNKAAYESALQAVYAELSDGSYEGIQFDAEPAYALRLIAKGDYTPQEKLVERIKATSGDMLPAYGVYANGKIVFSLPNEEMAQSVLDTYKESFLADKEDAVASFCADVQVAYRFVPKTSLKTAESALELLQKGKVEDYTMAEGESLQAVAARYQVSMEEIIASNAIKNVENPEISKLKIYTGEPVLAVKTVALCKETESIPFKTEERTDATQYAGNSTISQKGIDGEREVQSYVTEINGVETEREIISENVLFAAVNEIVVKGTKEPPKPYGTGDFAVPTGAGTLTSRFGSRWGRNHNGIDIAAPVGTEIYAADNGTVIYSEYNNGGYGYMLQIDHGNGLVTYYAHCSELLVPSGHVVAKGDLIARVGNTGRSTGAHLHFEVRADGDPIDPMLYIDTKEE